MSIQTNGNDQHVARFGHELKWLHAAETRGQVGLGLLHQHERQLIQNNMLDDDREVRMKLRRKFELGMDYFLDVKNTLLLWLAMWDELLGQKRRYDLEDILPASREMLDASFLSLVTLTRRLNIGSADPSLVSSESLSVMCHLPGLPGKGEPLGATVTGTGTEHPDDLDTILAVDSSDNEMPFDSGSDESGNAPDGTGDNTDLTEKGQSGSDTIFVLGDVDAEGNVGSDYVARAVDRRPECSLVQMRRRGLRPRGLGGNVASNIPKKRAANQCDAHAEGGRMLKR